MCTTATANRCELVRDYVARALYDRERGYFVKRHVVGSPPHPIAFTQLLNEFEYRATLAKLYAKDAHAWFTPVELFAPHYSNALAAYAVTQHVSQGRGSQPLIVYELGGGNGTNAAYFLDWVQAHNPALYKRSRYCILEISPSLQQRQLVTLHRHAAVATSELCDATQLSSVLCSDPCVVIALEVLDNLPHDKVVRFAARDAWQQTCVHSERGHVRMEAYSDVRDPLIHSTLSAWLEYTATVASPSARVSMTAKLSKWVQSIVPQRHALPAPDGLEDAMYLPTGAHQLVKALHAALPQHALIAADFHMLPPPRVQQRRDDNTVQVYAPARNTPLTASKDETTRRTVDHASYLSAPEGRADIFWATDFNFLKYLYDRTCRQASTVLMKDSLPSTKDRMGACVMSTRDFMARHAATSHTRTMLGYNPLLDDYTNTSMLLT